MNRGARHAAIFRTDNECAIFMGLLADLPRLFDVRVHGYALMPNHYHLMLESVRGNLSLAMRYLGAGYTQQVNRLNDGWDGPMFRGRYRNELVEDDAYWQHLLAYLHLNPVRGALVPSVDAAEWTSHAAYVGLAPRPDWLTTEELLGLYGSVATYEAYVDGVRVGRIAPPEGFDPKRFMRPPPTRPAPVVRPEPPDVEDALAAVSQVTGVERAQLFDRVRGPKGNPAAWVAVWWLLKTSATTQGGVAELMGVSRGRISQLRSKLLARAKVDPAVRGWMDALEEA